MTRNAIKKPSHTNKHGGQKIPLLEQLQLPVSVVEQVFSSGEFMEAFYDSALREAFKHYRFHKSALEGIQGAGSVYQLHGKRGDKSKSVMAQRHVGDFNRFSGASRGRRRGERIQRVERS